MNNCLNCGELVNNKYCNVSCQNKHQGSERANNKYGVLKSFKVNCKNCSNELEVEEREKLFPQKEFYYCCRRCANKRTHSIETKEKISKSLGGSGKVQINEIKMIKIKKIGSCKHCNKDFAKNRKSQLFCSRTCVISWRNINENLGRKAGLASVKSQSENRRSKNEIYFANFCIDYFDKVLTNEPIFNGWDADVIIEDVKFAVLWNGKWHYEKIAEAHSVKQVQNRDKIKLKEIKEKGYLSYVIKDMGKENKEFVEKEFDKFICFLKQNDYICV